MGLWRRIIHGNGRPISQWWFRDPDEYARGAARALATTINPASPASRGPAGTRVGLAGHGVNRAAGWTLPLQQFGGATAPIRTPESLRVGIGAGVSGQPGLPSTGTGVASLALMSGSQYHAGLGG